MQFYKTKNGSITDMNGSWFFDDSYASELARNYQQWKAEGNTPLPFPEPTSIDPQLLKSIDLKKAENNYIIYLMTMAGKYNLTITPNMGRSELLAAAQTAGLSGIDLLEARQTVMELLNDVNVNGGRYGDINYHPEIVGQ